MKIDKPIPFEHAALFRCGVITDVGSVVSTASTGPGESVAVIGLGGADLNALMAAVASGAGHISTVDLSDEKLKPAKQLGAHLTVNTKDADCVEQFRQATQGGANIAVETAGSSRALSTAFDVTRRGGIAVTAGMPGPEAQITYSHLSIAGEERTIKVSSMGICVPKRDIPRYLSLFGEGKLPVDKLLSRVIVFDDLNAAMVRLDDAITVREVLIP